MSVQNMKQAIEETLMSYMAAQTEVTYLPDYDPHSHPDGENAWTHIRALSYRGTDLGGKKTRIFAYIGFPPGSDADRKVPAIVLVHGGGGHAFAEWVKIWNDRGYAAIAMDTTGFFPSAAGKGVAGREEDDGILWQHGLPEELAGDGYTHIPNNDNMSRSDAPLDQQWMLHAVVSTIGAHNILLADERVDADKIGITGISWGGVITSIAIGYDTRYAFAVPVYGSGHLDVAHSWMGPLFSPEMTGHLWSAADRFDRVKMPVLWMCYANDIAFSVNSNSLSYDDTKAAGARLCVKLQWGHSHLRGWTPEESYIFADSVVNGAPVMTAVDREPAGRRFAFTICPDATATAITARAVYITRPISYSVKPGETKATIDPVWHMTECTVAGDTVTGSVPEDAVGYYVELTTASPRGTYGITTRFVICDDAEASI